MTCNAGNSGRIEVLKCLGMEPHYNTLQAFQEMDNVKMQKGKLAVQILTREARQKKERFVS
jgi:hypothetical protein